MKKTKTSKIVKSCQKDSIVSVERELQKDDVDFEQDLNISFLDENQNELYPITWCCKKGILSLVEMMVKKGADPNRSFVDDNGTKQTVIDWACQQKNASLIEVLLQNGSKVNIDTFAFAQQFTPIILSALSSQVPTILKELYHSCVYQAIESEQKIIDFNDDNPYIFAFNSIQANFIGIRQKNKGVIVDAGEAGSELMKTFRKTNQKYQVAEDECDSLIEKFNELKKCPGRVSHPFVTKYRAEPPTTYRAILNYCRYYCPDQVDDFKKLESKSMNDEESIMEIINKAKKSFLECEKIKQRHPLRIFFSGAFEIEAVFLTHPHLDHFSLIDELQQNFPDSFQHTKYILGGTQHDWIKVTRNTIDNWTNINRIRKQKLTLDILPLSSPSSQSISDEYLSSSHVNDSEENTPKKKESKQCSNSVDQEQEGTPKKNASKQCSNSIDQEQEGTPKKKASRQSSNSIDQEQEDSPKKKTSRQSSNSIDQEQEGTPKTKASRQNSNIKPTSESNDQSSDEKPTLFFTDNEFDSFELTLLNNVRFKVWGRTAPEDPEDKNQLCLLINMFFKGNNILFTGDAQGNLLQRMKTDRPIREGFPQNEKFDKIVNEIIDDIKKARKSVNKNSNVTEKAKQKLDAFLKNVNANEQSQYIDYVKELLAFELSNVIFEPHHGSMTEGSFDFYLYLSSQNLKKISFICSYPKSKDFLPKENCINCRENPILSTKSHPIVYAVHDNILTISMTNKPVYTTGAAGDNVYVMKIGDKSVGILDLFNETPEWEVIPQ